MNKSANFSLILFYLVSEIKFKLISLEKVILSLIKKIIRRIFINCRCCYYCRCCCCRCWRHGRYVALGERETLSSTLILLCNNVFNVFRRRLPVLPWLEVLDLETRLNFFPCFQMKSITVNVISPILWLHFKRSDGNFRM